MTAPLISAKAIATAALAAYAAGKLCAQQAYTPPFYYDSEHPDVSCAVGIGLTIEQRIASQTARHYEIDKQINEGMYRVEDPVEAEQLRRLQALHDQMHSGGRNKREPQFLEYARELAGQSAA